MSPVPEEPLAGHPALLALSAGTRAIGWAAFVQGELEATSRIALQPARYSRPEERAARLVRSLDELAARWEPQSVACCQAAGVGVLTPGLAALDAALTQWRELRGFSWRSYGFREVRAAVEGRANASRDSLAHAVMMSFGLIGHTKTTQEWEAIAVGACHLQRHPPLGCPSGDTPSSY